jgi:hypothetical protein
MHEPVPLGFTVKIPVGPHRNIPICWLNAGEIVVQGPLSEPFYKMHSIAWLDTGNVAFRRWPAAFPANCLPPQRPYQPRNMDVLEQWWDAPETQAWMDHIERHDGTLKAAADRRSTSRKNRQSAANLRGLQELPMFSA